jgi:superfamily II DNA or RNA helicase
MSISILNNQFDKTTCRIVIEYNAYRKETIYPVIRFTETTLNVPFAWGLSRAEQHNSAFPTTHPITFKGTLRPEQKIVLNEAIQVLNENHTLILATYTGFGKTISALALVAHIQQKTVIFVNRLLLLDQWKHAIQTYLSDANVQLVTPNTIIDPSADIFVMNITNASKFKFPNIGIVICDEVHQLLSKANLFHLLRFTPDYLIGLSATPYRTDAFQTCFELFFGADAIVYRPLDRSHKVFLIHSDFDPHTRTQRTGRMDWNYILTQQAEDLERNQLICEIIQRYPTRRWLVLCKRVAHIQLLETMLCERNIDAKGVSGTGAIPKHKSVLIGTIQKLGTGFDDASLDTLLIAADVQTYFIQYLGRVMRNPKVEPWIFDVVDKQFPLLYRHFRERLKWYKRSGGIIQEHPSEMNLLV